MASSLFFSNVAAFTCFLTRVRKCAFRASDESSAGASEKKRPEGSHENLCVCLRRCGARMSVQNVEKGFHATNRSDRKAAKAAK